MQEEASMDDILSSIRKILSDGHKKECLTVESIKEPCEKKVLVHSEPVSEIKDELLMEKEVFLLTPEMRVDSESLKKSNENTSLKSSVLTNSMSDFAIQVESVVDSKKDSLNLEEITNQIFEEKSNCYLKEEIKPFVQKWLDEHLPDIVEKVVREEVVRVLARVLK